MTPKAVHLPTLARDFTPLPPRPAVAVRALPWPLASVHEFKRVEGKQRQHPRRWSASLSISERQAGDAVSGDGSGKALAPLVRRLGAVVDGAEALPVGKVERCAIVSHFADVVRVHPRFRKCAGASRRLAPSARPLDDGGGPFPMVGGAVDRCAALRRGGADGLASRFQAGAVRADGGMVLRHSAPESRGDRHPIGGRGSGSTPPARMGCRLRGKGATRGLQPHHKGYVFSLRPTVGRGVDAGRASAPKGALAVRDNSFIGPALRDTFDRRRTEETANRCGASTARRGPCDELRVELRMCRGPISDSCQRLIGGSRERYTTAHKNPPALLTGFAAPAVSGAFRRAMRLSRIALIRCLRGRRRGGRQVDRGRHGRSWIASTIGPTSRTSPARAMAASTSRSRAAPAQP